MASEKEKRIAEYSILICPSYLRYFFYGMESIIQTMKLKPRIYYIIIAMRVNLHDHGYQLTEIGEDFS